jgi:hypothetical protein
VSKLDRFRVVRAHGRDIGFEDVDLGAPARKTRGKTGGFAQVPLDEAPDFAKATGTPGATVWVLLFYMAWKTRSQTFSLSNETLAQYGVSRWTKRRVLARLERAGLIKIQQRGHHAVTVTMLSKPKPPESK